MMPIQHPLYENAFYLTPEEVDVIAGLPDVNYARIAPALKLSEPGLHMKLNGNNPFTLKQFADFCMYARISPRDVFSASGFECVDAEERKDAA